MVGALQSAPELGEDPHYQEGLGESTDLVDGGEGGLRVVSEPRDSLIASAARAVSEAFKLQQSGAGPSERAQAEEAKEYALRHLSPEDKVAALMNGHRPTLGLIDPPPREKYVPRGGTVLPTKPDVPKPDRLVPDSYDVETRGKGLTPDGHRRRLEAAVAHHAIFKNGQDAKGEPIAAEAQVEAHAVQHTYYAGGLVQVLVDQGMDPAMAERRAANLVATIDMSHITPPKPEVEPENTGLAAYLAHRKQYLLDSIRLARYRIKHKFIG